MQGVLLMADNEPAASGGHSAKKPPKRKTVRVAKDFVSAAKRFAVLTDTSVEFVGTELLQDCIVRVEEEIGRIGPMGVRDRAEALDLTGALGSFNTDPAVATRLTSLAGQCITSVAKLVHPHLEVLVDMMAAGSWGNFIVPADPDDAEMSPENLRRYIQIILRSAGWTSLVLADDSLAHLGLLSKDILLVKPGANLASGDAVVLPGKDGGYEIRVVSEGEGVVLSTSPSAARPISIEEAKRVMIGRLELSMKRSTQDLVNGSAILRPAPAPPSEPAQQQNAERKKHR